MRVYRLHAFGTDAVAEIGVGVFLDEFFKAFPVSLVVPDASAVGADRQQPRQGSDLGEGLGQFGNQPFPFPFRFLSFDGVPQGP